MIKLTSKKGLVREVDLAHAERLLAYEQKYNLNHWQLPEGYTLKDGAITRTDTSPLQGAEKRSGAQKGSSSPGKG